MELFADVYQSLLTVGTLGVFIVFLLFLVYIFYKIAKELRNSLASISLELRQALVKFEDSQTAVNKTTAASLSTLETSTNKFNQFITGSMQNMAAIRTLLMHFQNQLSVKAEQCETHTITALDLKKDMEELAHVVAVIKEAHPELTFTKTE